MDGLTVPASYPRPRFLRYEGNDLGFATWSVRRRVESFTWTPLGPADADLGEPQISTLQVVVDPHPVRVVLPRTLRALSIEGDLSQFRAELPPREVTCPP